MPEIYIKKGESVYCTGCKLKYEGEGKYSVVEIDDDMYYASKKGIPGSIVNKDSEGRPYIDKETEEELERSMNGKQ